MHRRLLGLLVGGLLILAPAAAALAGSPADVTVRVEGDADTLVPRATVHTTTTPVVKDGNPSHSCEGTSGAGALELATAGDWTGTWFDGLGYSVDVVKGESHAFGSGEFWGLFVNDVPASTGLCGIDLQQGDSLLLAPQSESGAGTNPTELTVPGAVQRGQSFTAHVVEVVTTFDSSPPYAAHTVRQPAAGATVSGGGASSTTGADGNATLTLATTGSVGLRASKSGDIRSATETVCVHDGDDGSCGTTAPGGSLPSPGPCVHVGNDGRCGTVDRTDPVGRVLSPSEQQRFARGHGPRTLTGSVSPDPSGLLVVKLRLTRSLNGHCSYYSGRLERFRPSRCGADHGAWFAIGDRQDWSYLLPAALPAGRYVLDVDAIDRAANRDDGLQRGRNRVVFVVA